MNLKRKDYTGQKFGLLTVTKMLYNYNNTGRTYCLCDCDCGTKDVVRVMDGLKRFTPSCGCYKKEAMRKRFGRDIDGQKFGRLTVMETIWDTNPPTVKCKCDCGKIIVVRKNDVQSGHTQSCGCLQRDNTSFANYKDRSGEITETGVEFIKPLFKNNKGVWMYECRCPLCNHKFVGLPAKIISQNIKSCGCARMSKGAMKIRDILIDKKINFETEYSFEDLKDKDRLKFDFAIFDQNSKLSLLIEYDGKQHDIPVEYFEGYEGYLIRKKHDEMKNDYCIRNHIPLYRIPYSYSLDEIEKQITNIITLETAGDSW